MCGICGLAALDGGEVDASPLVAMSAALVHRGPDDDGAVVDGPVALAARRLSKIDHARGRSTASCAGSTSCWRWPCWCPPRRCWRWRRWPSA
jgi:asparagine synthetase B (glutamine-hydrolysing)